MIAPLFTVSSLLSPGEGGSEAVAESVDLVVAASALVEVSDEAVVVVISVDVSAGGSVLEDSGCSEVVVSDTPIVVITEGVPIIKTWLVTLKPETVTQHTCKEQHSRTRITVNTVQIGIDAVIHV
jgi:hypothetical protein